MLISVVYNKKKVFSTVFEEEIFFTPFKAVFTHLLSFHHHVILMDEVDAKTDFTDINGILFHSNLLFFVIESTMAQTINRCERGSTQW